MVIQGDWIMLTGLVDGVCGNGMVWRCRATRPILKLEGTSLFRFRFSLWRWMIVVRIGVY